MSWWSMFLRVVAPIDIAWVTVVSATDTTRYRNRVRQRSAKSRVVSCQRFRVFASWTRWCATHSSTTSPALWPKLSLHVLGAVEIHQKQAKVSAEQRMFIRGMTKLGIEKAAIGKPCERIKVGHLLQLDVSAFQLLTQGNFAEDFDRSQDFVVLANDRTTRTVTASLWPSRQRRR